MQHGSPKAKVNRIYIINTNIKCCQVIGLKSKCTEEACLIKCDTLTPCQKKKSEGGGGGVPSNHLLSKSPVKIGLKGRFSIGQEGT